MKIYEYQAKEILKEYGILVPQGRVATTPEEAEIISRELGCPVMVKAQILAGGRGKAGGIREAKEPSEAKEIASQLLGKRLVTPQTPPDGMMVSELLIQKKLDIKKEFYLGVTLDRSKAKPVMIISKMGGTAVEEIAGSWPQGLHKEYVDPLFGIRDYQIKNILFFLLENNWFLEIALRNVISDLSRIFQERDCLLVEINPLVLTQDNRLFALDAKMTFDDNALFRHPDIQELGPADIPYIKLTGNIGCMVNGAGLAMATMDTIKFFGGEPANFLDVGGSASPEMIKFAFRTLIANYSVKVVFINIFGGIFRCDVLAEGLLAAYREKPNKVPLVLRLEGNNALQGLEMLKKGKIKFFKVASLSQGAKKAVALAAKEESKLNEYLS